jgi:putative transposase
VIVDGATGLEKALAALWSDMLVQRCTVHKHRMIYADSKQEIESKRKAFIRKWRLKCRARRAVRIRAVPEKPVEIDPHIECN